MSTTHNPLTLAFGLLRMRTAIRKISIILSSAILLCMIVIVVLAWVVQLPHFKPYSLVVYDRHGE